MRIEEKLVLAAIDVIEEHNVYMVIAVGNNKLILEWSEREDRCSGAHFEGEASGQADP